MNLSSAAAAAVAAVPVEPVEPAPVEAVPLGNARDVQLDVQRRLILRFSYCEQHNDSRGCALLAAQIRLNAEWLRADAEEAPDAEPPVHVAFAFPKGESPARYMENGVVEPDGEATPPLAGISTTTEAGASPEIVVSPEQPEPTRMLGPIDVTLGRFR